MTDETIRLREEIVEFSRLLYERKYVTSKNGNVSALTDRGTILVTPSASCLGLLDPADIVEVDSNGVAPDGKQSPSLELPLHIAAYSGRNGVRSVFHAHPTYTTAFSLVGRIPSEDILPEFVVSLGKITFIPYATPGSSDLASMVAAAIERANALVLANHGAITVGSTISEAYMRMEDLENTAKVQAIAEKLGCVVHIREEELVLLRRFGQRAEGK